MEHLENNPDKKIAKRQKKSDESTLASQIMNFFSHADTITRLPEAISMAMNNL